MLFYSFCVFGRLFFILPEIACVCVRFCVSYFMYVCVYVYMFVCVWNMEAHSHWENIFVVFCVKGKGLTDNLAALLVYFFSGSQCKSSFWLKKKSPMVISPPFFLWTGEWMNECFWLYSRGVCLAYLHCRNNLTWLPCLLFVLYRFPQSCMHCNLVTHNSLWWRDCSYENWSPVWKSLYACLSLEVRGGIYFVEWKSQRCTNLIWWCALDEMKHYGSWRCCIYVWRYRLRTLGAVWGSDALDPAGEAMVERKLAVWQLVSTLLVFFGRLVG